TNQQLFRIPDRPGRDGCGNGKPENPVPDNVLALQNYMGSMCHNLHNILIYESYMTRYGKKSSTPPAPALRACCAGWGNISAGRACRSCKSQYRAGGAKPPP